MNKRFTKLIAALALLVFMTPSLVAWGQTRTEVMYTFSDHYSSNTELDGVDIALDNVVHATFNKRDGGTDTQYYTNGTAVRWYGGGTLAIVASNATISNIEITYTQTANSVSASVGTYSLSNSVGTWSGSTSSVTFTQSGTSGQCRISAIKVTYSAGGSSAVATTVTIDDTGITNNDINISTAAGSLSATVSANNTPIGGATVTWSGNNDAVATIDSDGVVTLVGAGTVTFTAAYAGVSGTYQPSSDTYEMTVTYQPTTIEITPNYTFWGKTAQFSGTTNQNLSGSKDNVELAWSGGGGNTYANSSSMRFYAKNTLTFTAPTGYEIKSIVLTVSGTYNDLTFSPTGFSETTWTGASNSVSMSRPSTGSSYATISKFTITIGLPKNVAKPTFSLASGSYAGTQNVTISCETSGATIYYTTDGTTPSANNGTQGTSVSIEETTTLKAIAIKGDDDSDVATANYTILTPLTTMQEIFDHKPSTSTNVQVAVTFNNWVITGVSSYQAYLTDGTKGCMIYGSGHGFAAGDVLSGTVICQLTNYYGQAEFKELYKGTTTGLNVTAGGTVTPVVTTIDALSSINSGSVVILKDLTYDGSVLSDGTHTITPYNGVGYSPSFTSGKTYDVTGVFGYGYGSDDSYKRIFPRSSADIVLKAVLDITASMTPFSYIVNEGPSAEQNIDVICTDLGSNTLTATASSDYEVSLTLDGTYTQYVEMTPTDGEVAETVYVRLKAGLSVGEHNGTVTFTADNLTTQNVALEGLVSGSQTYSIILTQPDEATIAADKAVAEAGQTVTLSYSDVVDCYEFTIWSVLYEIGEEIYDITPDANNQFTMPATDVYVYATFEQKTFTVNYSVNGTIVNDLSESVNCGSGASLWDETFVNAYATLPTGYSFAGWTTNPANTTVVASYEPEGNATLYAVLIPSNAVGYVKVTSLQDITEGTYFIVNDGYVLPTADATNAGPVKSDAYKITTPLSDSYSSLPVAGTEWTFTGTNTAMTIMNSATEHYLYVAGTSNNNQLRVNAINPVHSWSFAVNGTGFSMKDKTNSRYCATYSDGSDWRSYNSATASNYGDGGVLYLYKKETPATYTRVEEISTAVELTSIEPSYLITVENGGVLTLTGPNNGTATNLIIEDGGQLITSSTGVQATVKKDIEGVGAENWGEPDPENPYTPTGWYFIASPVDGESFSTAAIGDYDLYMLDWANNKWRNIKNAENASLFANGFQRGTGYLYASKDDNTLSVAGEIKPLTSADTAKVVLATTGWNLIGNPLTCKVTVDSAFVELNNASAVTSKGKNSVVNPYQGIAVYGTAGNMVTFTKATTQNATAPGNSALQMIVAQNIVTRGNTTSATVDNAVISFNEGSALPKFTMLESIANLYIPQGTKEYAIVSSEAQGTMPVNFRANENGTYTLTVNPENVEMNYLHLIDNMTGADVDLLQEPSYTFNAKTTDYESRFKLVFVTNNEDGTSTGSASFAFYSNGNWIINNVGEATLQVIDLTGRILSSETVNGSVSTTINATPGVYMLRLINGENVKVQKIVVR